MAFETTGRRLASFVLSGGVATAVSYVIFVPLAPHIGWFPAAVSAWLPAVIVAFLMNRRLTFGIRGRDSLEKQFGLYVLGALTQFGLSLVGYFVLIDLFGLGESLSFFINLIFTTAFSYAFMSLVTFRNRRQSVTRDSLAG
jgi:putative flippase GtrA